MARLELRRVTDRPTMRQFARGFLVIFCVSFITLWASYLFDIGSLAEGEMVSALPAWANWPPMHVKIPMPSFPLGIAVLMRHNMFRSPTYLNGHVRYGGWWYYFPEALLVKGPSALVLGMLIAVGLALYRVRRRRMSFAILIVAAALMAGSMVSRIQIGVRHLLPLIPLVYILVCLQLARGRWIVVLMVLIALSFLETAVRHPDYLSFFNIAARRGYGGKPLLTDSNLDWGQDVARLARWLRSEHPDMPYETRILCSRAATVAPGIQLRINEKLDRPEGLLIISKNVKYGPYWVPDMRDPKSQMLPVPDFIYRCEPIKRIGDSLEVYDFSQAK
jgi:hypothetical protein